MRISYWLIAALVLTACGPADDALVTAPSPAAALLADTLYVNGVIWTGAPGAADATEFAVRNGEIVYVGTSKASATTSRSDADVVDKISRRYSTISAAHTANLERNRLAGAAPAPDTASDRVSVIAPLAAKQTIDLAGRFVMPGFIDNHVHFLEGGAALASVELRDAATPEEFSQRIADYATTLPADRWVLNGNWDHETWGGTLPHRDWIDAATANTPVFVVRLDGHMALANTAALKLAGIDASTPNPTGGEIVRDANGKPTGILKDNAMNPVFAVIPAPSEEEWLAAFRLAQSHALSLGLTQVHAVTANPNETGMINTFRLARQRDLMKIRAYVLTPLESWDSARDLISQSGSGDETLRWGGVKGFVDGSLGSTTAWFHEPFTDTPDTSGFPLSDPATLRALIADADAADLKLAIHAIGDKAIDVLIVDMRATAGADIASRRYRIEHFQHPSRAAIRAAADSGIIASMQPYHAIDDGRWAEKRIGAERVKTTYAFRSILDAGGLLTFGSDWPVAPLSPLEGVYAAVTRRTTDGVHPDGWQPQEKITVEEALTAYTATNAYAGFEEANSGTLEPGKRADFVILTDDPREVDPVTIREIEVLATVISGETVFDADIQ